MNPSSGPGSTPYPNDQYTVAVGTLNTYQNVQTVGYVRTNYANRNISSVVAEISIYAKWASNSTSLAMHGIFFDEAPHEYVAESVEYMRIANQAVKDASGLQGSKIVSLGNLFFASPEPNQESAADYPPQTIHNPGVVPDTRYDDANTDITVVFEQSYPTYTSLTGSLARLPDDRSKYSYMVNSIPFVSKNDLKKFVNRISKRAEFLFVTDNTKNFYESFGAGWADFVEVVPT